MCADDERSSESLPVGCVDGNEADESSQTPRESIVTDSTDAHTHTGSGLAEREVASGSVSWHT